MTHAVLSRLTVDGLRLFFLQAEDVAPRLHVAVLTFVVGAAHAVYDGVRNLVDGGHEHRLDGSLLFGGERAEAAALALELLVRDSLELAFERADRRADVEVAERLLELHHFGLDDQLGALGLALALAYVRGDDRLKVVHVEDEEVAELADRRVNVAWHADVYEEGRSVAARGARPLGHFRRDDVVLRPRRADDDVGLGGGLFERVELDGLAAELNGQFLRGLVCAVGDEDARCARAREVLRGEFGHRARADHEDGRSLERPENLSAQLDRREADGDGGGGDAGLVADALGDVQRVVDELVQNAPGGAGLDGDGVGVAHLSEHLRLADDERVERGGNAEDVAHGGLVGVRVEVSAEQLDGHFACAAQEVAQTPCGLRPVIARRRRQNLHAVTRRDDQPLAHDLAVNERAQTVGARLVCEREPLAHFDGCRLVVESDENDGHELLLAVAPALHYVNQGVQATIRVHLRLREL